MQSDKVNKNCILLLYVYVLNSFNHACVYTSIVDMCDLGYCVYGSCIKSPKLSCQCNKGYTGTQCEVRLGMYHIHEG